MNKKVKQAWLAALRSGQYKQGKDALSEDGRYCCLGVLCDISGQGEWKTNSLGGYYYAEAASTSVITLTKKVRAMSELEEKEIDELMELNDCSEDFLPVIKYIEEKL